MAFVRQSPTKSPQKLHFQAPPTELRQSLVSRTPVQLINSSVVQPINNVHPQQLIDEINFLRQRNADLENQNKALIDKQNNDSVQVELWRNKYEQQLQSLVQTKANYELEIQSLSKEVHRLVAILDAYDVDRTRLDHTKQLIEQQAFVNTENLKRSLYEQGEIKEQQVRKLREMFEDRTREVEELAQKLQRQQAESDNEIQRLVKENEILRQNITTLDIEKQRELEHLRQRIEGFNEQNLETLKNQHRSQIIVMEGEINKLRSLLEVKNREIETLIQQNMRLKANYEAENTELRLEIEGLKNKVLDLERIHRSQLEQLQARLLSDHQAELDALRAHFNSQLNTLEQEIASLRAVVDAKQREIQNLLNEKNLQRDHYENLLIQLKREIEDLRQRYLQLERDKNIEINNLQIALERSQQAHQEHANQLIAQIQFLEQEIHQLKELINQKNKEIESNIHQFNLQKRQLEDEIRNILKDLESLKNRFNEMERAKHVEIEELRNRNALQDQQFREKAKQMDINQEQLLLELRRLKEALEVRTVELEGCIQQRNNLDRDNKSKINEIEAYKMKILNLERERVVQIEDLRVKMDQSNIYQIENLKNAFNTQTQILAQENHDLKNQLDIRMREIGDLINKYQQLELSIRNGQINAETIANKNIYDAYVTSKQRLNNSGIQRI